MAFTPANVPFDLWVGNHKTIVRGFSSTDDAGVTTPIDLTGMVVFVTVFNGDTKLIEKSTTAGTVLITGTASNQVEFTLSPDDTRVIAAANYDVGVSPTHEIEIRDGGKEETWVYGKIKLKGGDNVDQPTTTPAP